MYRYSCQQRDGEPKISTVIFANNQISQPFQDTKRYDDSFKQDDTDALSVIFFPFSPRPQQTALFWHLCDAVTGPPVEFIVSAQRFLPGAVYVQ